MRRALFALIAFVSACQEDPGVTAVLDDAGRFVRVDASEIPDAGEAQDGGDDVQDRDAGDKVTTTPTE